MTWSLVSRAKSRARSFKTYQVAAELRSELRTASRRIRNKLSDLNTKMVSLKPDNPAQGNVLISYYLDPFLFKPGETVPNSHPLYWHESHWECRKMAEIFLDLGYAVDVIHWTNRTFRPKKNYAVFIDVRWNMQRLAPLLNPDCLKIMHIDVCHVLFQNAAEAKRLLDVQQRKGVNLLARAYENPNLAIEHADCATIYGNEFTLGTFRYANKPLYAVPISHPEPYDWPVDKDFEASRTNFMWFGSQRLVRKGLDVVLDAFAETPEYHLTVCGPIDGEEDFKRAYAKELYDTPNIETVGWVDIRSQSFLDICNRSAALIYPSCAEGQCGGVATCLHAGLIPVISYESGFDVRDFGIILRTSSIQEVKEAICRIANLKAGQRQQMARKAWEYARAHHTREAFTESYRRAVVDIIDEYSGRTALPRRTA